jgi:alkyl hydroperoxide reductase subunit AhpC
VLFFYPLDWTFVCPTEIIAFSEAAARFKDINCELIGCSVDSVFSHLQWVKAERKTGGLGGCNFPLLSDLSHKIAKDYDVLIEVSVRITESAPYSFVEHLLSCRTAVMPALLSAAFSSLIARATFALR